jgi:C4-dicarboxylate-specific signal transduction histidine kinase
MEADVRTLILDNSLSDMVLIERTLRSGGVAFLSRRADSREPFMLALEEFAPELVIADYALPAFDGIEALALARAKFPGIPFILISGYIGEERAIEAFEAGITDLVLKDRISRLVPSVQRALREVKDRDTRALLQEELHALRSEFAHLARINDLSEMAAAIAHEINQPLTAITNYIETAIRISKIHPEHEVFDESLTPALDQALRAGHIVRRLRQFIGRGDGESHATRAADLVDASIALALTDTREKGITVIRTADENGASVNVDAVQIQQVLVNLMRNAVDALETIPRDADRRISVETRRLPAGNLVEFVVADTGPGFATGYRERLFQPFVTSKAKGMGMGLSVCRRIIEAHKGTIEAESSHGMGATFRFSLPQYESSAVLA